MRTSGWLLVLAGLAVPPPAALAADVQAGEPTGRSVTVYRNSERGEGPLSRSDIAGYALITETRSVSIPAGDSRVVFEGVSPGIEPSSVIVANLPATVVEKDNDADLLSRRSLLRVSAGQRVTLVRTHRATGITRRDPVTVRAVSGEAVVFDGPDGIEALDCSGVPETFTYTPTSALTGRPTLSVRVRSEHDAAAVVTLSYLSRGFDWAANYVGTLSADGRRLDLGAWVTLANDNAAGFPDASVQVVAGRVNRVAPDTTEDGEGDEEVAMGRCWPRGTTSDVGGGAAFTTDAKGVLAEIIVTGMRRKVAMADVALAAAAPARLVEQEQLGDLKLYRVPEPTTVASNQMKQVRLLERSRIPVSLVYVVTMRATMTRPDQPTDRVLMTRNDKAHALGLPLPSGGIATSVDDGSTPILLGEATLRDIAVGEDFEIAVGRSHDVRAAVVVEQHTVAHGPTPSTDAPAAKSPVRADIGDRMRVSVTNARSVPVTFELRLDVNGGDRIADADHRSVVRNGRTVFPMTIPARGSATLRYHVVGTRYVPRAQ